MEGIARRAGVGKPTIYRHWPNAAAVAMAAFLETATQPETMPRPRARRLPISASNSRRSPGTFAARTGRNVKAMIAASQGETELAKAFRYHFIAASRQAGRDAARARRGGRGAAPGLDLEVTLDLIYGPLYYRLLVGHASLDRGFTDALLDQVLQGLQADPVPGMGR